MLTTVPAAKANLQSVMSAAKFPNVRTNDANPNLVTKCTNKLKTPKDTPVLVQYYDGVAAKALGDHDITKVMLKDTMLSYEKEALAAATLPAHIEGLIRAAAVVQCVANGGN